MVSQLHRSLKQHGSTTVNTFCVDNEIGFERLLLSYSRGIKFRMLAHKNLSKSTKVYTEATELYRKVKYPYSRFYIIILAPNSKHRPILCYRATQRKPNKVDHIVDSYLSPPCLSLLDDGVKVGCPSERPASRHGCRCHGCLRGASSGTKWRAKSNCSR